jgi:hypothetical protein
MIRFLPVDIRALGTCRFNLALRAFTAILAL